MCYTGDRVDYMIPNPYNLIEELFAFDHKWQARYATMRLAARAAGLEGVYLAWRESDEATAHRAATLAPTVGLEPPLEAIRGLYEIFPALGQDDTEEYDE